MKFINSACYVLGKESKATNVGSHYQLEYKSNHETASFAKKADMKGKICAQTICEFGS